MRSIDCRAPVTRFAFLLTVAMFWPHQAVAQPIVRSMSMVADLTAGDGSAAVHVEIVVVPDETAGLRLELLGFGDAAVDSFRLTGNGPALRFTDASGTRAWTVIAPADFERAGLTRVAGGDADAAWQVNAQYVVRNAITRDGAAIRARVPVLTPGLAPAREAGDAFAAVLRLPADWSVTETFPTRSTARGSGEYAVALAVAPAMIGVHARTDGAWRPGVPLVLDLVAGAILLVFVAIGWRHLRTIASASEA